MESVNWPAVISSLQRGSTYSDIASGYGLNVHTLVSWCRVKGIKKRTLANSYGNVATRTAIPQVCCLLKIMCLLGN